MHTPTCMCMRVMHSPFCDDFCGGFSVWLEDVHPSPLEASPSGPRLSGRVRHAVLSADSDGVTSPRHEETVPSKERQKRSGEAASSPGWGCCKRWFLHSLWCVRGSWWYGWSQLHDSLAHPFPPPEEDMVLQFLFEVARAMLSLGAPVHELEVFS